MALIFDTVRTENFHTHGSTNNARFTADAWGTKHQTDNGYILFGPANSSHAHIYTDRANFYFNKQIQVLGVTTINQNDIRTPILYDYNDTGYYVNPAGTSNLSALNVGGYPVLTANTGGVFTDGDLTLNMSNDDGLVYDDSNNTMYVKADGSNYAIIDSRGGTISGVLTMNGGGQKIALNNGDITGVNQITINDPGEGIVWTNGSSGNISLATIDDSSDNILNVSGTGATLAVNGATVLTTSTGITNSGNDTRTGNLLMYSTDTSGNYGQAAIELKEVNQVGTGQSAYQYAPAIAWHWGGRKQMQMRLHSDGHLYVDGSNYGQSKVWTAGNDGSGSGLDADTLDGFQLDSSSNTGARASVIPYIKSDSVMEIGKYLDFHDTGSTADYDIRLSSSSSRLNVDGGYFQVNGVNSVRASFFYDLDNTNYYLNPAGQSLFGSGDTPELKLGPNTSYSKYLYLGGWGTSKGDGGWVRTSNGNLHLEGANPGGGVYLNHYVNANVYLANGGGYAYIYNSARAPIFYDLDNTTYYTNPASRSELTSTNLSLNDATALANGTFNVSKTIKGGIHFTNGAGTGTSNGYQASITFQGSSAGESQAGIYVHNNNSAGTYMALATTNNYSNGPQVALRIDNNGRIFADRNYIQSNTDMRAPLFYDSNDTGYYLNPAAGSKLSYLGLATDPNTSGSYRLNMGGSIDMNNNAVHYLSEIHFQDNVRFYDDGNDNYLDFKYGDADYGGIKFYNGGNTFKGTVYASNSGFGLLDNDGHWAVRIQTGTNPLELRCNNNVEFQVFASYTLSPGSTRAPIFYDSDNTAYYINGDGTSYLNNLNVNTIDADNFKQLTDGVPRNNLGSPTVTEMALFDRQFGPKTTLANNYNDLSDLRFYKQDTSSSAWTEITTYSDDQKRRFLRTANSSVIIPYGVYKFRVEFKAPGYVYANAMYGYWSSQGHSTQIQVWKYNQNTSSWSQHTSATNSISSWPGHMYLPFSTIPWHETNTTSTGHFSDIRFEFTPNWNASYSSNNIALYGMEIWGGYPAGKRDIHSYDQDGRFIAWGDVHVGNGDLHASKIYDYNNTGYYLDPNSAGYSVRIAGDIGMNNGYRLWFSSGDSNWQFGRNIYSASGESLTGNAVQLKVYGASDQGFQILDHNNVAKHEFSGDGTAYFDNSVYSTNFRASNAYYLGNTNYYLNNDGSGWYSNVKIQSADSLRAPIFYDSDNTNYYINPADGSRLIDLNVTHFGIANTSSTSKDGISLYSGPQSGEPTYGILFSGTAGMGTHGAVTSDWATYLTMSNTSNRGWIFRRAGVGNSASISAGGAATFDTSVTTGVIYDVNNTSYNLDPNATSNLNVVNANSLNVAGNITADAYVSTDTSQSRAKFRLWNGSTSYAIGMKSGYTYGHLNNNYAMSFQMNNDNNRGFWWGDEGHSDAQGAMSLTTTGQLTVATSVSIGEGETVTSPSTLPLYVSGNSALHGLVSIGSNLVSSGTGLFLYYNNTTTGSEAMKITQTQYAGVHIRFIGQSGSQTGSIGYFGSSTTYNTSSDYRLKENVVPMVGAIDRVNQLKPSRFNWIGDPDAREVDGFIAHEVSEIVPEAITGVKDELDAEGNPLYQGIDQSKLVPLLTAALQEAIAKIEDLENRLQILENQ